MFEFFLDIIIERNKNLGCVNVEFVVFINEFEFFFVICGYEIVKIGLNLKCIFNKIIMEVINVIM